MEFNALQQYRSPADSFPFTQQRSRNAGSIMYSCGTYAAQPQTALPTARPSPQPPFSTWSFGGTAPKTFPLQRRSTVMVDSRNQSSELGPSGSLTMTAQAMRSLGLQNPQGEYLPQPAMQQPPVQQVSMPQTTIAPNSWTQPKGCGDFDFGSLEPDLSDLGQGLLHHDEDTPIIDLRQYTNFDMDNSHDPFQSDVSRRMSESSFSMSSNGPLADVPTIEDYSTSEVSIQQDYDWSSLEPPAQTLMSPIASPRPAQHDSLVRSNSRSRASPIPNLRASPYTLDSGRNKRWSTGMYPSTSTPPSRPYQFNRYSSFYGSPLNPQNALGSFGTDPAASFQAQNYMFSQASQLHSNTLFSSPNQAYPEAPQPLPSQGLFRLLQSNADRLTGCSSHFADLSDPPDLYSSLHEEPSNPPEEDMNPSDPDLMPHEQDLRFNGDLYTPRWVRGHGNKREGWCGLCKPGRWLVLKNSAFWYDKSFTHGVSAATGAAFQGPQETRRTEGNLDVWEGLCGSCGDWIALVSSKKKGTTWFRHAYKCHTHPKVKDGPKRKRETTNIMRTRAPSITSTTQPSTSTTYSTSNNNTDTPHSSSSNETIKPTTTTGATIPEIKTESCSTPNNTDNHQNPTNNYSNNNQTPLSTPQLSHTQLSTPQIPTMAQTPSSSQPHQPLQTDSNQNQHFHHALDMHQFHLDMDASAHFGMGTSAFGVDTESSYNGLSLGHDGDDLKTMNPMDSFANMI